jgi:hypothetical protein
MFFTLSFLALSFYLSNLTFLWANTIPFQKWTAAV